MTNARRAQIAIEVLASDRPHGTVTRLAQTFAVSHQTIYAMAAAGKHVSLAGLVGP